MDQAGMKAQLCQLYTLLNVTDHQLAQYLSKNESGNMFFCFRWLLVLFKREFSAADIMKLWEILWTDLPCKNFHLLLCVAILDTEKSMLMENRYGFTEILKVFTSDANKARIFNRKRNSSLLLPELILNGEKTCAFSAHKRLVASH